MQVHLIDNDGDMAQFVAYDVKGLEVDIIVHGEYHPGQPYKRPCKSDPIGDPEFPSYFEIEKTYVYVGVICGEERYLPVELSRDQNTDIELAIEKYIEEEKRC